MTVDLRNKFTLKKLKRLCTYKTFNVESGYLLENKSVALTLPRYCPIIHPIPSTVLDPPSPLTRVLSFVAFAFNTERGMQTANADPNHAHQQEMMNQLSSLPPLPATTATDEGGA